MRKIITFLIVLAAGFDVLYGQVEGVKPEPITNNDYADDTAQKQVIINTSVPYSGRIYNDNEVDSPSSFAFGNDSLYSIVSANFKMPAEAIELGISGDVSIQFILETDGTITDVKVVAPKENQLGHKIEEECLRVVRLTNGQWQPAMKNGNLVRSYWRFPFTIDNSGEF